MVARPEDYPSVQAYAAIVEGLPILERGVGGVEQSTDKVTQLYEDVKKPQAGNQVPAGPFQLILPFWPLAFSLWAAISYADSRSVTLAHSVEKELRPINFRKRRGETMVIIKNGEGQLGKYPFGDNLYCLAGNDLVILSVKHRNGNSKRFRKIWFKLR